MGVLTMAGSFFAPRTLSFLAFFKGGSFVYFSYHSLSAKPQLIFTDNAIYVGFWKEKWIPRKAIRRIRLVVRKKDFRKIDYLELITLIKGVRGRNTLVQAYPVAYLNISKENLHQIISEWQSAS